MGIKLDVGGGRNSKPGYRTLDLVQLGNTDYVCPAWETLLDESSVSALNARHFLEHLTLAEAKATLKEWLRIMIPGAVAVITVPNLKFHARQLTMPGMSVFVRGHSNFEHALAGFYGWQSRGEEMGHRYGYTPKTLYDSLRCAGFIVHPQECRECDIVAHAVKPTGATV